MICTIGRPADLERCLSGFDAHHAGVRAAYEIVVVENGPRQRSVAEVLHRHATLPIRVVHEPTKGLSVARNTGIEAAGADVVVFIDDDAVPAPSWVDAYVAGFADPTVLAAGGPVTVQWLTPRPPWMNEWTVRYFGHVDFGDRGDFPAGEYPYGANMAIRRNVVQQVGGFDPRLGRVGSNLVSCEENALFRAVAPSGRIAYLPAARVDHYVSGARATRRWVVRREYGQGRSEVLLAQVFGEALPAVPADLRGAARGVARSTLRALTGRARLSEPVQVAAFHAGRVVQRVSQ